MTITRGGLRQFEEQLCPAVVRSALQWRSHPELHKLLASLEGHTQPRTFFNVYAEAVIARHLLKHDCDVRFEVPTPGGKRCDFEVARDGAKFYLHVKRIETHAPVRKRLTVSSRLRILERIERPYIVNIRWHEGLTDRQMQDFVQQAEQFILHARVGDEMTAREKPRNGAISSHAARELGGLRILAPWNGTHVTLAIGMPSGFVDAAPRIRKLLVRAYQQFMPRAENVILMGTTSRNDADEFDAALLGSHIERWDTHPPSGRRVAHGRATDGFWSDKHYEQSRAASWFRFTPKLPTLETRLWMRDGASLKPEVESLLRELFSQESQ